VLTIALCIEVQVLDTLSTFKTVTLINSFKIVNSLKICYLQHDMSKFCCEGCKYNPAAGVRRCGPVFDEQNAKSFSSVRPLQFIIFYVTMHFLT
jgi:hypothetical protein